MQKPNLRKYEFIKQKSKLKVQEYKDKFANPYVAAAKGYIDSVITPQDTRKFIVHALEISGNKTLKRPAKKHGIPPF